MDFFKWIKKELLEVIKLFYNYMVKVRFIFLKCFIIFFLFIELFILIIGINNILQQLNWYQYMYILLKNWYNLDLIN